MTSYNDPHHNVNPNYGSIPPPPPPPEGDGYQHSGPIPTYSSAPTPQYRPMTSAEVGVDNTGVPVWTQSSTAQIGTSFFRALFDMSFRAFITRKLATVIYTIGLVVIGLAAVLMLLSGLASGLSAMSYSSPYGLLTIFGSLIGVPVGAVVAVIILRLSIEAGVALVAVAENTERTAENTTRN